MVNSVLTITGIIGTVLFLVIYKKNVRVKLITYFIFFYFLTAMLILIWPFLLLNPRSTKNARIVSRFLKFVAQYTDLKFELRNGNILAEDRAAVIVANHQSALDVLGLYVIWDIVDKMTVAAKKELFYLWPLGITFYLCGIVFVDRKNAKGAYKELQTAANKLRETKTKIWICPEGTRNKDMYKLLPFKKGAFSTAVEAQLPIIPVVFSPYHFLTKGKEALLKRGPIIVESLEPESTIGLTADDVPALMERVRVRMESKYRQLSEEVLNYPPTDIQHSSRPVLVVKNS